jgi:sugar phosphate isomerase/epimerase
MFTLSAFADEIDADPKKQVEVLKSCGLRHIELRSILNTNVLSLTDLQVREFKSLLDEHGFSLSAIGSPIGKTVIDQPFDFELKRLQRAIELCHLFKTRTIRIFSYYLPENGDWQTWRTTVLDRMEAKVRMAEKADVRLVHENEHRIYGDSPERVHDLLSTVRQHVNDRYFGAAFDPANFVFCGFDPWDGWLASCEYTVHFHIKDWRKGGVHGALPGQGDGQIERVMADAVRRGYHGFATLEPHLLGGGPTGGYTGPELFPRAVQAFREILERIGAQIAS